MISRGESTQIDKHCFQPHFFRPEKARSSACVSDERPQKHFLKRLITFPNSVDVSTEKVESSASVCGPGSAPQQERFVTMVTSMR